MTVYIIKKCVKPHYLLITGQKSTEITLQANIRCQRSAARGYSEYISSMVSAYMAATTERFSFSVGDSSPPSTEKSVPRTRNFFTRATLEGAFVRVPQF